MVTQIRPESSSSSSNSPKLSFLAHQRAFRYWCLHVTIEIQFFSIGVVSSTQCVFGSNQRAIRERERIHILCSVDLLITRLHDCDQRSVLHGASTAMQKSRHSIDTGLTNLIHTNSYDTAYVPVCHHHIWAH